MFKIISIILCTSLCLFPVIGNCQEGTAKEQKIQNDVKKIDISINIKPIKDSQYCYNFTTNTKNQIDYIIHMLNAIDCVEDRKIVGGGDIPIVNINLTKLDNSIAKYGFVDGRFYDTTNKQYAVDKNEYNCFLDFIYALKTEKIVLEDEVIFEPSEWSKVDIEKAMDEGLVPELNQINYRSKITRLEVCQLIENLLEKKNITKPESTENPFSDTTDQSIVTLYNYDIIHGKTDSKFYPYDYVTREELSKILSNTYYLINPKVESDNLMHEYVDQQDISYWALNYVRDMYLLNIMIGNPENEFKPRTNVTKEELIITLLRI